MNTKMSKGAQIIVENWLEVEEGESLLIVTSNKHMAEANEIKWFAKKRKAKVEIMSFPDGKGQIGHYFDEHERAFDGYDVVLGATTHSLVTTKAVKRAVEQHIRFLSLPLSTNDERSMLEYDFLHMDVAESKDMALTILPILNQATSVRITTKKGTDLTFRKQGRDARFFTGSTKEAGGYASSSFEVYIPIEEDQTEGVAYVDASLGYIGEVEKPIRIDLKHGRIVRIDDSKHGVALQNYMSQFEDEGMYVAGELGIGLNRYSECKGNCYIEDESCYGTFHIGFGRNIALGGIHEAKAHFDLVFHRPDIYADGTLIMEQGEIVGYDLTECAG